MIHTTNAVFPLFPTCGCFFYISTDYHMRTSRIKVTPNRDTIQSNDIPYCNCHKDFENKLMSSVSLYKPPSLSKNKVIEW